MKLYSIFYKVQCHTQISGVAIHPTRWYALLHPNINFNSVSSSSLIRTGVGCKHNEAIRAAYEWMPKFSPYGWVVIIICEDGSIQCNNI